MQKLFITTVLLFFTTFLISQESHLDFQFINSSFYCNTNQVCFEIQVRENIAHQNDGSLELADVNYRFFYPSNLMSFVSATGLVNGYFQPQIDTDTGVLGSEVLDLFGPAFDGEDGLGWVDFSIQVDGNGNAITVSQNWVSTAEVCFTPVDQIVQDQDFCTQIIWSIPSYHGVANYYKFAYLTATEVTDGGGSGIAELTEETFHYGWHEDDMDLINGCEMVECTVLPIELVDFAVTLDKNETVLNWTTATEINSSHFEVERRTNLEEHFTRIASVEAAGTSFEDLDYIHIDQLPTTGDVFYYRLRLVDKDGSFTYSPIRIISKDVDLDFNMKLFPNPTSDFVNINYQINSDNQDLNIEIYDQIGKQVGLNLTRNNLRRGQYAEQLDLRKLPNGMYILNIQIGHQHDSFSIYVAK
jgi:hypothetical protein